MASTVRLRAILLASMVFGFTYPTCAAADTDSGEKIYKHTLASTVWVLVPMGGGRASTGSGSLIDINRRLILTNYHVVGDRDTAVVFFPIMEKGSVVPERKIYLKNGQRIPGKVIVKDSKRDLALIQLEVLPPGTKALRLSRESAGPGQRLHSIGNPGASEALWAYTSGTVRQVYRKHFQTGGRDREDGFDVDAKIVETQSPVNSGDSGGPVVNDHGELVAVTQGHLADSQARLVSIFIDVSEVWALLASKKLARLPPPPREAVKPKEVEAASDSASTKEKPTDDTALKMERDASRKLKFARMFADDGLLEKARLRYKEIVETYPETKAAREAQQMLEKLNK